MCIWRERALKNIIPEIFRIGEMRLLLLETEESSRLSEWNVDHVCQKI